MKALPFKVFLYFCRAALSPFSDIILKSQIREMLSTAHYNHEQNHSTATSSYHQDVNFQPANVFLQQLLSRANIVATEQDQTTRSVAISKVLAFGFWSSPCVEHLLVPLVHA